MRGVSGAVSPLPWRESNFQLQISAATKLYGQKLAMKAKTEKKERYFAICAAAKLLPK